MTFCAEFVAVYEFNTVPTISQQLTKGFVIIILKCKINVVRSTKISLLSDVSLLERVECDKRRKGDTGERRHAPINNKSPTITFLKISILLAFSKEICAGHHSEWNLY